MIRYIVANGQSKTWKIKPKELIESSVQEIAEEKFPGSKVVDFDGSLIGFALYFPATILL
jgi:hypothetical protein